MTAIDPQTLDQEERRARRFARINKADAWFRVFGLSWLTPILKAAAGDNPRAQMGEIWRLLGVPLLAIGIFLMLWATLAPKVQTNLLRSNLDIDQNGFLRIFDRVYRGHPAWHRRWADAD